MDTEILTALSNININSETAEIIMAQYLKYQYFELLTRMVAGVAGLAFVFCAFSKVLKSCPKDCD